MSSLSAEIQHILEQSKQGRTEKVATAASLHRKHTVKVAADKSREEGSSGISDVLKTAAQKMRGHTPGVSTQSVVDFIKELQ